MEDGSFEEKEANWSKNKTCTYTSHHRSLATPKLMKLLLSNYSSLRILDELVEEISEKCQHFDLIDVFLTGKILAKLINDADDIDLSDIAAVIHYLVRIDKKVLKMSQSIFNATSVILNRFDEILSNINTPNLTDFRMANYDNIVSLIVNLSNTNINGVALYNSDANVTFEILHKNNNTEDILSADDLKAAVIIPEKLLQQVVDVLGSKAKLVLTIFENDSLFISDDVSISNTRVAGDIFDISLPGFKAKFKDSIKMIFKSSKYANKACAYWTFFSSSSNKSQNSWTLESDVATVENHTKLFQCEYWHVTHFALLIFENFYSYFEDEIIEFLEIITIVNCILSLLGSTMIFITFFLFRTWRSKSSQILIHFITAVSLQVVMLYLSNGIKNPQKDYVLCAVYGALLHYFVLSEFCWMLVVAVLQFKRYVKVLEGPPKHLMAKACTAGWILPCIPVACLAILEPRNYTKDSVGGICYPSGNGLYLAVFLPVAVILASNVVIYFVIIIDIFFSSKHRLRKEIIFQLLLIILLFFMLGLSWVFAFINYIFESAVLIIIFCTTSTLQGFVMFLFFVVFNKKTRKLYRDFFGKCFIKR